MERTYIMLKPDCVKRGLMGEVISRIEKNDFAITNEQIDEVRNLMDKNFSHYTVGDDASNKDNWYCCSANYWCFIR